MKTKIKWAIVIFTPVILVLTAFAVIRFNLRMQAEESWRAGDSAVKVSGTYRDIAWHETIRGLRGNALERELIFVRTNQETSELLEHQEQIQKRIAMIELSSWFY